jgi:hypothetical protein
MNISVAGVLISLVGFLILFYYGMPFRVPTGGVTYIITQQINEEEKKIDRRYKMFGFLDFLLAVVGGLMQAYGSWH